MGDLTGYIVSAIIALIVGIYLIIALVAPERF
jgi:K+-transporting ATPase KdpF subunit